MGRGSYVEDEKFGSVGSRFPAEKGRIPVCGDEKIVRRGIRPRRILSKGVRLIYHFNDGVVLKENYNVPVGLRDVRKMKFLVEHFDVTIRAIGCEEGAMTVHYTIPRPSWIAYASAAG